MKLMFLGLILVECSTKEGVGELFLGLALSERLAMV